MTHECWNEVIHQNNIHPILPNNLQVMEIEQAFSIHSVLLLYIKNFTFC